MRLRRVVLDTSAYSRLRANHPGILDMLAAAEVVVVPAVVLGELAAGFAMGTRAAANQRLLAEFLEEPFVSVQPVNAEVASCYGVIFAALRRLGRPLPANDIWIAASAQVAGGQLVTFDRDFESIPDLALTLMH